MQSCRQCIRLSTRQTRTDVQIAVIHVFGLLVEIARIAAEIWQFLDFSKMAAVRHLGFLMRVLGPPTKGISGLYHFAKFGWNRCSSFNNMHVYRFREFGLKTPIHAQKVFGG